MNKAFSILIITVVLTGCLGMPDAITPVTPFNVDRYLGKWYEIARLDHSFERGLEQVTAEYSLRDDGGITVINRGYSPEKNQWQQAEGKAYFVGDSDTAYLKVSFFGPFYGSYVVFELGDNYDYAFVSGPDTSYLWLLSRTPTVAPALLEKFKQSATQYGFDIDELIMVKQLAETN